MDLYVSLLLEYPGVILVLCDGKSVVYVNWLTYVCLWVRLALRFF